MISETDAMTVARQNAERAGWVAEVRSGMALALGNATQAGRHAAVWDAEPFCLIRVEMGAADFNTKEGRQRGYALAQRIKRYEPERLGKLWDGKGRRTLPTCLGVDYGTGEWMITNAMLQARGDFLLWAERAGLSEIAPGHAVFDCLRAVEKVRRCQCWDRYQARGGLQEIHLKLLRDAWVENSMGRWDGMLLCIEGKRPFGGSYREMSVLKRMPEVVLPRKRVEGVPEEEWELDDEAMGPLHELAWEIIDELGFALPEAAGLLLERWDEPRPLADWRPAMQADDAGEGRGG